MKVVISLIFLVAVFGLQTSSFGQEARVIKVGAGGIGHIISNPQPDTAIVPIIGDPALAGKYTMLIGGKQGALVYETLRDVKEQTAHVEATGSDVHKSGRGIFCSAFVYNKTGTYYNPETGEPSVGCEIRIGQKGLENIPQFRD